MRISVDVVIRFTSKITGTEIIHPRGRIFILSDLFLASERMTAEEKLSVSSDADMWLLYPPLAGKHLKVAAVDGRGKQHTYLNWTLLTAALDVQIMRFM